MQKTPGRGQVKGAAETGGDKNRSNEAESLGGKDKGKSVIWMDIENAEFVLLLRRRKHMEEYVLYAGAR